MSTATRQTFAPAVGGMARAERDVSALTKQYSARDLPSHKRLKFRAPGQSTIQELHHRDFRRELEDRERAGGSDTRKNGLTKQYPASDLPSHIRVKLRAPRELTIQELKDCERAGGSDERKNSTTGESKKRKSGPTGGINEWGDLESSLSPPSKKKKYDQNVLDNLDEDDAQDDDDTDSDEDSDEEELVRELERIRRLRVEQQEREEQERQVREERIRIETIVSGNPLLNLAKAPARLPIEVKRRWDEDVVFKNCAASEPQGKTFINDTLRSEFHKRFMDKYFT
nr:protein CWC15 homolog [Procambarus clarkii]